MTDNASALDRQIKDIADGFATQVAGLSAGTFTRGGIVKEALNSLIWSLYHTMPNERGDLAVALEGWPEVIREADIEDSSAAD